MAAAALSFALFAFWTVVGYAVVSTLYRPRNLLQNALLAPVVGTAVTLLPVFYLNRVGLPVRRFGPALAIGLLLLAGSLLWRFRPAVPVRASIPFLALCLFALAFTGRPMLRLGFNWLSYGNDDMANYVLGAHRFLDHGFFDLPDAAIISSGRDASSTYWFVHVVSGVRPGSELLLAWVVSCTGLDGFQVFMPLILAFHLVLICATGGLIYRSPRLRYASWLGCLLLTSSSLASLGVLYQLIAQVFGIGLLCGSATVLMRSFVPRTAGRLLRQAALAAILLSALLIAYPEVVIFLVAAIALYAVLQFRTSLSAWRQAAPAFAITGVLSLILTNRYIFALIEFGGRQTTQALDRLDVRFSMFPYFLVPSGLANLWGLVPIGHPAPEPWLSLSIAAGAILLVAAAVAAVWQSFSGEPIAMMAAVMIAVGALLFARRLDFASFKVALYIQPFLLGTVTVAWSKLSWRLTGGRRCIR